MDDPWGSPWAAADSDKDHKLTPPSAIAPPPRAFLSASNSPRLPATAEESPWAGDDAGFGDWATAPDTPSTHAVWSGGWGASSPNLAPTSRDDAHDKTSPIAWPGTVATPRPANGSAFRQPSPDPWASGFSSRRPSHDGVSTPRLVVEVASPVEAPLEAGTFKKEHLAVGEDPGWDNADTGETRDKESEDTEVITKSETKDAGDDADERATAVALPSSDVRLSVESATQGQEYQSSTPSNDNTDHEEERQDSPISSLDEEPRAPQQGTRKVSGKVQELVVKFDGIARAASEEPAVIPRGRSRSPMSRGVREGADDTADFGDFEDADDSELPAEPAAPRTPERTPPREASGADATPEALSPPRADVTYLSASPIALFGPLDFQVDLSQVAKLFPTLPEPPKNTNVDYEVPDHVISDSFGEISERKTWYRVSRLGSSRRHNAGDDESYRRVAWPSSTVHQETIQIVRRWMEEDSIAGRVALGGGISKTQKNMFGWDSSAEPVTLDAVFGKKKAHARASSLQPLQPARVSLEGIDGSTPQPRQNPAHRTTGSDGPGFASFGWSSTPTAPTAHARQPSLLRGAPAAGPAPANSPVSAPQASFGSRPAATAAAPASLTLPARKSTDPVDDEDDDGWGEMVSSPATPHPIHTESALKPPLGAPVTAASGLKTSTVVDATPPAAPQAGDDAWGAADFSVFESAPAKATTPQSHAPPSRPGAVDPTSARGPTAAPRAGSSVSRPSDPTTLPSAPAHDSTFNTGDDETAQRIISSLPDLSYMLR
ncbi:hypothetical protein C8A05DRAFT_14383 [Staphylotrichum tortipilum]|uniref:Glucan 1, 4-alpha-glucosidase n=1 Tax=Staphylotrichum tortipilum TaxID=2831512 RepID=A0AAN6RUW9_9PEZI|nr:hypothetical protein C8A05DRAFT_14383 [Staphylotrichum longicolle]